MAVKNYEDIQSITFDNQMNQLVAAGFSIKGGFTYLNVKGDEVIKYTVSELKEIKDGEVVLIIINNLKGELMFMLNNKQLGPII